jgi:sigma-B regulation protein RsbU (phosphoserine phosphatase)
MSRERGHILVVDDQKMNRLKLSAGLQKQGHTVALAENGLQALEMLRSEAFDLVLLDILMPEMDGYQVLARMKKDALLRDIPVIVISALNEMESIIKGIEMGAEDYLPKTFDPVLLRARISACLEKKRLRDQQEAYLRQLDIENRRKSEELRQARQIQRSMLPESPPLLPHLEIAARQETASEVGGDYYEFFAQDDGKYLVIIGDATGHGVGSALMVSMIKALLLAHTGVELVPLLDKLNTILCQVRLGQQLNMALLLLEVWPSANGSITMRAMGGGIPPLYILRAEGDVHEVLVSGLPLGISDEALYHPSEFSLASGEALLLMSDGLVEQFNAAGEFLGYDRLFQALHGISPAGQSAPQLLQKVSQIGTAWAAGHPLHDDVTLVVMKAS